jgi:putative hydrolase of the HAD superfamily
MTGTPAREGSRAAADPWLILDVDDTLVATFTTGFAKCVEVARSLGLRPPSEAAFAALYGRMEFDECVRRLHPRADLREYHAAYDALAGRFPPEPLCDGHAIVAAALRTGMRCGILTNGPAVKTTRKLRACGMDPSAFDFVISGDTAAVRKPHPASFTALSAYGIDPDMAWYVSDSAVEWRAAESVGLRSVGVLTGRPVGHGFLPTLQLCDAVVLPDVVPVLARVAGAPRTSAPTAVTFDAGFTLIEPVQEPADIIRDHLGGTGPAPSTSAVRAALAAAGDILAAPERWWNAPGSAEATLRQFYEKVLTDLGCPSRADAGDIVGAYTEVANWRAVGGADELLAAVRASGRRVGVLSNWQPSLREILVSTGLDRHVDAVVPSTLVGAAKPAYGAFHAAADALGVALPRLVHVGDQLRDDVFGALLAGCRAIHLDGSLGALTESFLRAGTE